MEKTALCYPAYPGNAKTVAYITGRKSEAVEMMNIYHILMLASIYRLVSIVCKRFQWDYLDKEHKAAAGYREILVGLVCNELFR